MNLTHFAINKFITNIQPKIKILVNLKFLNISNNRLQEFSFLKNLNALTQLNISKNQLEKIPNEIYYMTNLKKLILNFNKITEISIEIKNLNNVKFLNLIITT